MRGSANCATASERPGPSKLAGEFRRGRSGNREDSSDSMRLGERGLGDKSWSSLVSLLLSVRSSGGIDCEDDSCEESKLAKKEFFDAAFRPGDAKSKLPSANARLFSDCFLNCSNSGFCSTGMILGEAAAVERTLELGGLQFPRMCCAALEEKWSVLLTARPK